MTARPTRRPPSWLFALLAMLLVLATEQVIEHYAWRSAVHADQSRVQERLSTLRARLEGVINSNLLLVHGLTAVIAAQPDIDQTGFTRIARGLVDSRHALRHIAGAPDMVISLIYPLAGNEAAIGLNYLSHPTQGAAARRVMQTGKAVVAGPLPLSQGGIGIIAREPVYVPAKIPGEPPRFWGLVSAVIDVDQLYRTAELSALEPTLRLAIRGVDGAGKNGAVFYGDAAVFSQSPITQDVSLPGGSWQLAAIPVAGWGKGADALSLIRLLGLLAALLSATMAWRLAQGARTLVASTARMRALLNTIPELVWLKDPDGRYLACNPRFELLYGAQEADLLGKNDFDFVPAELAEFFRANDRAAIAAGQPTRNEEWLTYASDGHGELVETIKTPVFDPSGRLLGVLGIARDITERKKTEQRINGLNRVYAVLSGINETIVRQKDRDSLFQEACRIAVEAGGFRMAWLGMVDADSGEVRPSAHAGVVDGYLENLHISLSDDDHGRGPTGTALRQGLHVVCNDIATDPHMAPWREAALALGYHASAALPIKVGGEVRGAFNLYSGQSDFFDAAELRLLDELALDIGFALEYLAAEDQVRRGEAVLNSVFQALPDLFFLMDADGTIRDYRARSGGDLYVPPQAFLGKRMQDVLPSGVATLFNRNLAQVEAQGGLIAYEYDLALAHGERRFEARLSRLPESTQLIAVVRDITGPYQDRQSLAASEAALRQSEENLRQLNASLEARVAERTAELDALNQSLESFVYSVSHDLKTPLRGVEGYSRLLEEDYADRLDAEGLVFIANIRSGVVRMGELIDDLLAYSRMDRRKLNSDLLALPALVRQLLAERADDIAARGVEIVADPPPLAVRGDADGLALVLRNLLENAVKFSAHAAQPRIEIGARELDGKVQLWLRDNGIGFDMKYHDRIFEIFQRLHRLEEYPGTGIGLALVKKAMQRMGGRVWAESAPGEGATFFLELPAAQDSNSSA